MKNYRIVFCEANDSLLSNAVGFFREDPDVELVPCKTVKDTATVEGTVQGLVIDTDFLGVRDTIAKFREDGARVLLTTNLPINDEDRADDYEHDIVLYKPYSLIELRNKMIKSIQQQTLYVKLNSTRNVDERLSNIFIRAGIPPHIKGYQFLREAVKLAIVQPEIVNNITKKLYPSVAKIYDTSPTKVERAIRHAIEIAWNRGKIENINAIFGIKIYGKGEKPTNGELIALIADKVMIESV